MRISGLSLQYVIVEVTAIVNGQLIDPTTDVVQMAFMTTGSNPASGDWKGGDWETYTDATGYAHHRIRCLVAPAQLANGTYDVWTKITDSPEIVVSRVGQVTVY